MLPLESHHGAPYARLHLVAISLAYVVRKGLYICFCQSFAGSKPAFQSSSYLSGISSSIGCSRVPWVADMLDAAMMVVAVAVGSRYVVACWLTMSNDSSVWHSSVSSSICSSSTSTAIDLRYMLGFSFSRHVSAVMLLCAGQVEVSKFSLNAVDAAPIGSD